jgi:hypothetical protein
MRRLMLMVAALIGCETTTPAHREAEVWMLATMTRENIACFREWERADAGAAKAWLAEGADAKVRGDFEAMGRNLDQLECRCGASRFVLYACPQMEGK